MKKKLLITLFTAVIVVLCTCVVVLASKIQFETGNADSVGGEAGSPYYVRENAPVSRTYKDVNGEEITLNYRNSTSKFTQTPNDIYTDSDGNEYRYDTDGNLVGIFERPKLSINEGKGNELNVSGDTSQETDGTITIERAVEIAEAHARKTFPEEFEGMKLFEANHPSGNACYFITFAKTYGDGGFVRGEICIVMVKLTGSVYSCKIPNYYDLQDFSDKLLDGITEEKVLAYAFERANEIFPSLSGTTIKEVSLGKIDGKFVVRVGAIHTSDEVIDKETQNKYNIDSPRSSDVPTYLMYHDFPLE